METSAVDAKAPVEHEAAMGAWGPSRRRQRSSKRGRRNANARAIALAVALAAVAFLAVVASNLGSLAFDHLRTSVINANWEFSWSHDVDVALLAVGVFAGVRGLRADEANRGHWMATAGILALLVLDELSPFHGRLRNLDKLLYAPILVVLVLCLWRLTASSDERVLVRWGIAALIVAFGMHVAGLHLLRPLGYTNYTYQAGVGVKEGTELAGLVVLVIALWRRAVRGTATR